MSNNLTPHTLEACGGLARGGGGDIDGEPDLVIGEAVRRARKQLGLTQKELGRTISRPREWVSALENANLPSPPTSTDIGQLQRALSEALTLPEDELLRLHESVEARHRARYGGRIRRRTGRPVTVEVVQGREQVADAIVGVVQAQGPEAIVRNVGIKTVSTYHRVTDAWRRYREALGAFLATNSHAMFKRAEYVTSHNQLSLAKEADERLRGGRELADVHNVKVRFFKSNPLVLHVLVGEREAVLAIPDKAGASGSSTALVVRDASLVAALQTWFDEVVWDSHSDEDVIDVRFDRFDECFEHIEGMYGFED